MSKLARQVLSAVLCLALVVGAVPLGLTAVAEDNIPAGYTPIYTPEDLDTIRNDLDGNYVLMNDIDLAARGNWEPIGDLFAYVETHVGAFTGTLDGDGYEIQNLTSGASIAGLFAVVGDGAHISRLGITGLRINNADMAGGITAYMPGGLIENCYVQATFLGVAFFGGIVGHFGEDADVPYSPEIRNCYSLLTALEVPASDLDLQGGIAGATYQGSITNCYSNVTPEGMYFSEQPVIKTSVAQLSPNELKHAVNLVGFDFTTPVWFIQEGKSYPKLRPFAAEGAYTIRIDETTDGIEIYLLLDGIEQGAPKFIPTPEIPGPAEQRAKDGAVFANAGQMDPNVFLVLVQHYQGSVFDPGTTLADFAHTILDITNKNTTIDDLIRFEYENPPEPHNEEQTLEEIIALWKEGTNFSWRELMEENPFMNDEKCFPIIYFALCALTRERSSHIEIEARSDKSGIDVYLVLDGVRQPEPLFLKAPANPTPAEQQALREAVYANAPQMDAITYVTLSEWYWMLSRSESAEDNATAPQLLNFYHKGVTVEEVYQWLYQEQSAFYARQFGNKTVAEAVAETLDGFAGITWADVFDATSAANEVEQIFACVVLSALTREPVAEQPITFPDPNFEAAVRELIGKPSGDIYASDVAGITMLDVSSMNISNLTGLEHFTALEIFYCYDNPLAGLDVSHNLALQEIACSSTNIAALDLLQNINLILLVCGNTKLTELDLSQNPALLGLICPNNELTALDLSNNPLLQAVNCRLNYIASEDDVVGLTDDFKAIEPGIWDDPDNAKFYGDVIDVQPGYVFGPQKIWSDWTVRTAATCTAAGVEFRTWAPDGTEETRAIPALSHDYVAVITAPTTDAQGYTTHTCVRGDDSYIDTYTDKLPSGDPGPWHDFDTNQSRTLTTSLTASEGIYNFSMWGVWGESPDLTINADNIAIHDGTIHGDLYINGANVTLTNVSVGGSIYINKPGARLNNGSVGKSIVIGVGVGDGEVYIVDYLRRQVENQPVPVLPYLYINGGGSHSVYVTDSEFAGVEIDKTGGETVRVVVRGSTIEHITAQSAATIDLGANSTVQTISINHEGTTLTQDAGSSVRQVIDNTKGAVDDTEYFRLWGKTTKWPKTPLNWLLCILLFGWLWMAF
ncbi:MAG: hypothetical protein LBJ11_00370 [Oscillospiraceae bacterium]|jgi:hypothetical protein|nr:hypothetical protein [Oscillospiraceae bacterium]